MKRTIPCVLPCDETSSEGPKYSIAQGRADRCCQGLSPWSYFAQKNSSDLPGGLNGVAQWSLLLRCPASSGCISMRLGKGWREMWPPGAVFGLDSQEQAQSCSCRCFSKEWMSISSAGYVGLVPVQGIKREICFWLCNPPLQKKPAEVFFSTFFHDKHKSLWWSQDPFSNILTQAACCVVCKSPIFFLRKINRAHYLAEKRSLCQFHWKAGLGQAQPLFVS